MKQLRIALLVCDTPLPVVCENYGDYPKLFEELFRKAHTSLKMRIPIDFILTSFDVTLEQYPENVTDFDAYVLTGSKFSAYEKDTIPWIKRLGDYVVEICEKTDAKLVGICFGHQIIAQALDGSVVKNPKGWEVGWTEMSLNERGMKLFGTDKTIVKLQQMHQDHVATVPPGFEILAYTEKCPVHAMIGRDGRILTVQGHPEFVPGVVMEIVKARKAANVFSEDVAKAVQERVNNPADSAWFAEQILSFIAQPNQTKP
ncbi:class I glutamine amidotransferase-like protein [Fimicolochytrium jonesii]|uniref:class I glutamine amidotransferase-like protein n=1 Tax=Fimicolochytrium jonesii TaxID=1396493 RepID=UPI0022FEE0B3|nr:class I glutamine amidotransferase-like protein [Fimicolochytrium jonesii]KAI8825975.1 class I glutamine amidotransferase-like protein [Fimicolochytrium jonesii]